MHLKTKRRVNKNGTVVEYLQIVESYRSSEGKPKHRVILSLGRKDDPKSKEKLSCLTHKLANIAGIKDLVDPQIDVSLEWSKVIGPNLVIRKLWNDLNLNSILAGKYHEHVLMMVVNRVCDPRSKLSCMRWKDTVYEPLWNDIQLHELYHALDWLMKKKERIEYEMFWKIRDVFNQDVDLMLFDTTSVSYFGEGEHAPELLKFGHSKDKRSDLKQLMIGLLMTKGGIPVAHEVFPGNQIDLKSFPLVVAKARDKFGLKRVVWVCDRGMISKDNIDMLEGLKQEYIIGVRMRQMESGFRAALLDDHHLGYNKLSSNLFVKEREINGRRYIVCYNPTQAKEDAINREHFKEIIQRKVVEKTDKSWIVKNGYKKYLKLREDIIESVDFDRLEKEKIYDGKWILLTNTKLKYSEVARYYKSLCQIENAFRELKSTLDVKPIYHWTEKRIRGHIFVCFLALVLELGLQNKLEKVSYSELVDDLKQVGVSLIKVKGVETIKRTRIPEEARYAFEQLKLSLPETNL